MQRINYLTLFLLLFFYSSAFSTPSDSTVRIARYGGPLSEFAYSLVEAPDSGFYLGGVTNGYGPGGNSMYLVRTNKNGQHIWSNVYGGTQVDQCNKLLLSGDTALYLIGFSNSYTSGDYDGLIIKTDAAGNERWHKSIGTSDWDFFQNATLLDSGGMVVCGYTYSHPTTFSDGYVVKLNAEGDTIWTLTIGTPGDDRLNDVIFRNDSILLVGYVSDSAGGVKKGWLLSLDRNGHVFGQAVFNSSYDLQFNSILDLHGRTHVAGSMYNTDSARVARWLGEVDLSGATARVDQYPNTIGGLNASCLTANSNLVLAGVDSKFGKGKKGAFLFWADEFGNYKGGPTYGEKENDEAFDVIVTDDGRIAACGYTQDPVTLREDAYLVIFPYDSIEVVEHYPHSELIQYVEQLSPISVAEIEADDCGVYPNPASDHIKIGCRKNYGFDWIRLYTATGSVIEASGKFDGEVLDTRSLSSGIYFFTAGSDHEQYHGRFVVR